MVRIYEMTGEMPVNAVYCLATEYQIKGGFVPKKVWVFETDADDLVALRKFVDDYFSTVLGTELYVKEVPQDSMLFEQESERLYGTVGVFCGSGTK